MKTILHQSLLALALLIIAFNIKAVAQNISTGGVHSLFLCSDQTVKAWGWNNSGQLGDGSTNSTLANPPVTVSALSNIIAMAGGGYHSLFLKNDGTVWGTGQNLAGQLGDGTNTTRLTAVQIVSLSNIIAISGGTSHSIFLKNDGTVWATGAGELGNGSTSTTITPVQLTSLSGVIAISAGHNHSLFLKNDGTVWSVGQNNQGQLGDGSNITKSTPVQIAGLSNITAIYAGFEHSLFLKNDGTVWSCGYNNKGQLGDGTKINKNIPLHITSLSDVRTITGGQYYSLFLKNDNSAWACGDNFGYYGNGTLVGQDIPVQVNTNISEISAGYNFTLFLKTDGTLWASGVNNYGQLGDGGAYTYNANAVQTLGLCPLSTSVNDLNEDKISIYPNPSSNGIFTISNDQNLQLKYIVYNSVGQKVFDCQNQSMNGAIDLSSHSKGLYFLNIQHGNDVVTKKLIVQ